MHCGTIHPLEVQVRKKIHLNEHLAFGSAN